jgi:hypothetical protein
MDYLFSLPKSGEIPAGQVVVHNEVSPTRRLGSRGFRAWLQSPDAHPAGVRTWQRSAKSKLRQLRVLDLNLHLDANRVLSVVAGPRFEPTGMAPLASEGCEVADFGKAGIGSPQPPNPCIFGCAGFCCGRNRSAAERRITA